MAIKRFAERIFLACALIWLPTAAQAQPFPTGPITLVVPLAPGDAADIAARALGEELSRLLKTPVLSINRPGAGGAVGAQSVVQARKDGHTILFAQNSALTFRAVLDPQSVTYDALRDLVPLGTASRTPSLLVVRSDAPYQRTHGCGARADSLRRRCAGHRRIARRAHRGRRAVARCAGCSHQVRGIPRPRRFEPAPGLSDIPTMRELGYQEELFGIWFSFLAPAGIPEEARKALVGAIEQAVKAPAITARLASLGILQSYATPEQTAAEVRAEFKRVGEMARKTGLVK